MSRYIPCFKPVKHITIVCIFIIREWECSMYTTMFFLPGTWKKFGEYVNYFGRLRHCSSITVSVAFEIC